MSRFPSSTMQTNLHSPAKETREFSVSGCVLRCLAFQTLLAYQSIVSSAAQEAETFWERRHSPRSSDVLGTSAFPSQFRRFGNVGIPLAVQTFWERRHSPRSSDVLGTSAFPSQFRRFGNVGIPLAVQTFWERRHSPRSSDVLGTSAFPSQFRVVRHHTGTNWNGLLTTG